MSFDKSEIENNIKQHIKESNPELLLYIDNHYIDELINLLIEAVSIEIAKCIKKDELRS